MMKLIGIVAFILLVIWLSRRLFPVGKKHLYEKAKDPDKLASHDNAYEAVTIHSYKDKCPAAARVAGKRFLSSEAPPIPLESCKSETCHCVYMHHSDRRTGSDRRKHHESADGQTVLQGQPNRRRTGGRRAGDLAAA
jgi:hypothetical protein